MPSTRHHLQHRLGHQLGGERETGRQPWRAAVDPHRDDEFGEADDDRAGLAAVAKEAASRLSVSQLSEQRPTDELAPSTPGGLSDEAEQPLRTDVRAPYPSGPSDADLLDGCRAGNATSWRTLVDRYSRVVYTVALRAGVTSEDAKDITQSTFIALLESGSRIRQDERLASWLITVTQRKAWRARRRLERELVTTELPDRYDDPHETWESVAVIHAALSRLGGPCEQLLTALYLDPANPSYAEIAARMGRAIGTIGPTRARCLEKMRSIIGKDAW